MRRLLLVLFVFLAVGGTSVSPGLAVSRLSRLVPDRVVARDTSINEVLALDGTVVYFRARRASSKPRLKRAWMRIVHDRVLPARGVAARRPGEVVGRPSSIGRDGRGRVVIPFTRAVVRGRKLVATRWWIYDVVADRSRPLRGVPNGPCAAQDVAIWGSRLAYADCKRVYLRSGGRTHVVPIPRGGIWLPGGGSGALGLRGATLFGQVSDTSDGIYLALLADASGACKKLMPGLGAIDAGELSGWLVSRRYLTWTMGGGLLGGGFPQASLVGGTLQGRCRLPGTPGLLFTPPPDTGLMTVDDRFAYYGDSTMIMRHRLPVAPAAAPPPNDNFKSATPLGDDASPSVLGTIGTATTEPGEPSLGRAPATIRRTVWYAFRPTATRRVAVTVMEDNSSAATSAGLYPSSFSVFTGDTLSGLTGSTVAAGSDSSAITLDAVAGQTYWIRVASTSVLPDFRTFRLTIRPSLRAATPL